MLRREVLCGGCARFTLLVRHPSPATFFRSGAWGLLGEQGTWRECLEPF